MTSSLRLVLVATALLLATYLAWDGNALRLVSAVSGPRAVLDVSGQQPDTGMTHVWTEPAPITVLPPTGADPASARLVTSVAVQRAARKESGYTVQARLASRGDAERGGIEVAFYDVRELLGSREMLIGTATTSGLGTAQISYMPAEAGTHVIVARPVSWDSLMATEARTSFEAQLVAPPAYAHEFLPLESFSSPLPLAGAAVLAAIWAIFVVVVIGSLRLIPRGATRVIAVRRRAREL